MWHNRHTAIFIFPLVLYAIIQQRTPEIPTPNIKALINSILEFTISDDVAKGENTREKNPIKIKTMKWRFIKIACSIYFNLNSTEGSLRLWQSSSVIVVRWRCFFLAPFSKFLFAFIIMTPHQEC